MRLFQINNLSTKAFTSLSLDNNTVVKMFGDFQSKHIKKRPWCLKQLR